MWKTFAPDAASEFVYLSCKLRDSKCAFTVKLQCIETARYCNADIGRNRNVRCAVQQFAGSKLSGPERQRPAASELLGAPRARAARSRFSLLDAMSLTQQTLSFQPNLNTIAPEQIHSNNFISLQQTIWRPTTMIDLSSKSPSSSL